jgi:D-beta-D-heptose 7-phosphate kinase/D-beta-D-heptose 1-phosphate adenosyltransferase
LRKIIGNLKREGKRVVFTNGCFDILHVGHIRYLTRARKMGDLLIVGLNTDRSVRTIKGPRRPIVPQEERAEVLAALEIVDYIVLFDEPDPLRLITALKPHILVKGADWSKGEIIGRDLVEKAGGTVARIPLVPGSSSTNIIQKILKAYRSR